MTRVGRSFGLGLLTCLLAGASACAGEEPAAEGEDEGEEPASPPQLLGAEGEALPDLISLAADQTGELEFVVGGLRSNTRVELDGHAQLPGAGAPAWLETGGEDERLHLPLGGALVVGRHELALVHEVGGEQLRSSALLLEVEASSPGVLEATLAADPAATGVRLLGSGQGSDAVLGLVDEAGLLRAWAGAWGAAEVELELPGLGGVDSLADPSTWSELTMAAGPGPSGARWLMVAWLDAGHERAFARIAEVTGPGELVGELGPVIELWDLAEPEQAELLGPHEYATLHGVEILERSVVVAAEARRDLESPGAGDRLLATHFATGRDAFAAPIFIRGSSGGDLDLVGEARRWAGLDAGPRLGLREDRAYPAQLREASNGLVQIEQRSFAAMDTLSSAATWMRMCDAALGSRHVFALELGGDDSPARIHLILALESFVAAADDGDGDGAEEGAAPGGTRVVELPASPSAAPSLAALAGVPTLLVPQGPDAEVLALRSTGDALTLEPVVDLYCEAVHLYPPSADGVADTVPLACLRAGELRLGFLGVD